MLMQVSAAVVPIRAAPVGDAVFWAGEATNRHHPTTAAGARVAAPGGAQTLGSTVVLADTTSAPGGKLSGVSGTSKFAMTTGTWPAPPAA
jgi:hypothetical protein